MRSEAVNPEPAKSMAADADPVIMDAADAEAAKVKFEPVRTEAVKSEPVKTTRPDPNVIKSDLAKWSPPFVVSSYRRLSLIKHPDKEGGSPEAFQELTEYARILTEACAKFHGIAIKKKLTGKKTASAAAPFAKDGPKEAICAELPAQLKVAVAFFGFSEESFRCSSSAE